MSPPGKRLVHSSNKINPHSSTPASSVPSTPKTNELHYSSNVSMASQSRSDYSSSSSQHERVSHAEEPLHPSFKSRQTNNSTLDHSIASPPTSSEISSVPESRQGLGLCKLKPNWAETRPVSRRIILRPVSSPALTDSGDTSSPPRPDTKSKPLVLVKKKSSKYLRKVSSVPEEMRKFCMCYFVWWLFTVVIAGPKCRPEKKKSQPSRTQPYEAPYFFPPPIPIDRTSSRGKLPRTQTLPSPQRRQLASPVPPLPVRGPIASR
jgi:hypothetical protein